MMCRSSFALALLLMGCGDDGFAMSVDLKTDFVPSEEFVGVRVDVVRGSVSIADEAMLATPFGADYVSGQRVLNVSGLEEGTYRVTVTLVDVVGAVVAARTAVVDGSRDLTVTVLISRDTRLCDASSCGTGQTCAGAVCVDERCSPEKPDLCPPSECNANGDCATAATCAVPVCVSGTCFYASADEACDATQWCRPDEGCVSRRNDAADAGVPDASVSSDAGSDAGADVGFDVGLDAGTDTPAPPLAESCLQILAGAPLSADGLYMIDPGATGTPLLAYCDMTAAGGGWTLVGRSVEGFGSRMFGWNEPTGTSENDALPYSMGPRTESLPFSEILVASYTSGKELGAQAYVVAASANFVDTYAVASLRTESSTILGSCDPFPFVTMLLFKGQTSLSGVFWFRDSEFVGGTPRGLFPGGWDTFYEDCEQGGSLHGLQGMLLVR